MFTVLVSAFEVQLMIGLFAMHLNKKNRLRCSYSCGLGKKCLWSKCPHHHFIFLTLAHSLCTTSSSDAIEEPNYSLTTEKETKFRHRQLIILIADRHNYLKKEDHVTVNEINQLFQIEPSRHKMGGRGSFFWIFSARRCCQIGWALPNERKFCPTASAALCEASFQAKKVSLTLNIGNKICAWWTKT